MSIDNALNILHTMYGSASVNFNLDDFLVWCDQVWEPTLKARWGGAIDPERAFEQWCTQGGRCAATVFHLTRQWEGGVLYSPALVRVFPKESLSEPGNCRVVVAYVASLYECMELPWDEFMQKIGDIKTW